MEKLHQEITLDIISRLPVESVLHCRLVCKNWRNLISLPYFADMHLRHQLLRLEYRNHSHDCPTPVAAVDNVGFLLSISQKSSPIFYLEYDENEKSYKKVKKINHPPLKKLVYKNAMVGSCNGLICFYIPCRYGIGDPVYICNPITNEYINLPRFNIQHDYKGVDLDYSFSYDPGRMVSGFGYNPSTTEYKVVRIIYYATIKDPIIGRVQVYTLGDGNGWREKGEIAYTLISSSCVPVVLCGILANGALHWLDFVDYSIVAFDLEKEEFSLLPPPPCFRLGDYNDFQLQVLGGCLCVVQLDEASYESLNIWSFKKKSCEWESMFNITCNANRLSDGLDWPITLTVRGEVLLRYSKTKEHSPHPFEYTFLRYDPKTKTTDKLMELVEDLGTDLRLDEAIPHMSSFVSLRALGENAQRIR